MIIFYSIILHYQVPVTRIAAQIFTSSPQTVYFCVLVLHGGTDKNTNLCNTHFVINPASECTKPFYS